MKSNQFSKLVESILTVNEGIGHSVPETTKQKMAYASAINKHRKEQLNTPYEDKIVNLYKSGNDLDTIVKIMSRYGTISHSGENFDKVTPDLIKTILQRNGITI